MAETNNPIPWNTATWVLSDATGTPLTYTFVIEGGTVDVTEGRTEDVWMTDNAGLRIGVAPGAPTRFAQIKFKGKLRDAGKHASDVSLADVVNQTGVVSSTWVSTFDTQSSARKRFNLTATIPDRTLPSGTVKGGVCVWEDVDVMDGFSLSASISGGFIVDMTWESVKMAGTWTRNT